MSNPSRPRGQQASAGPARGQQQPQQPQQRPTQGPSRIAGAPPTSAGAAPRNKPPSEYDLVQERRDTLLADHWVATADVAEVDYKLVVAIDPSLKASITDLIGHGVQVQTVSRVPTLGAGEVGKDLGTVEIAFLYGDEVGKIKEHFDGVNVTVKVPGAQGAQPENRSAFAPSRPLSAAAPTQGGGAQQRQGNSGVNAGQKKQG